LGFGGGGAVAERHREISEEESNVNVVIKHQLGNRAGEGGCIFALYPFSSWFMFKCLKTLLLGVIYSMKRGEN
jgi:hypothetical protein